MEAVVSVKRSLETNDPHIELEKQYLVLKKTHPNCDNGMKNSRYNHVTCPEIDFNKAKDFYSVSSHLEVYATSLDIAPGPFERSNLEQNRVLECRNLCKSEHIQQTHFIEM